MRLVGVLAAWVFGSFAVACGARTELGALHLDAGPAVDAARPVDGAPDAAPDVAPPVDAAPPCDYGVVTSAVDTSVVTWNGGQPLPAGHYRITYVDGCMKYASAQGWTVNAYAAGTGPDAYWIVSGTTLLAEPPGTIGFLLGQGGFATFDECVQANVADAPLELDFGGGPLGVQLFDSPSTDNVAGDNGHNPSWRLSRCPP